MDTATRRYILVWAALGIAGVAVLGVVEGTATPDPPLLAILVVAAVVADRIELSFDFEREHASFTLIEVVITAGLLLVPPFHAVLIAVVGTSAAQVLRRGGAPQIAFGAGQAAVGVLAAALVVLLLPPVGPLVEGTPVLSVVLGMGLYVLVNLGAIVGLFRRLGGEPAVAGVTEQIPLTAGTMVGQIATGVVLAAIIELDPLLAPFVVAPAAAVYLAARGATRTTALLATVRAERDRLTRVIDGATDGIVLLDQDGLVQVWSDAMVQLTGRTAREVTGSPAAAVLDDRVRTAATPVRGRWLLDGADPGRPRHEIEATLRDLDGSERVVVESHALVFDERGRCTGDVIVVRDVSRQRELDRLRSDFVARVSHELRTPLTPIRGYASILLHRGDAIDVTQRAEALESIVERADHLGQIIEDLLLVTRADRGDLASVVELAPTDPRPIVEDVVAAIAARHPGHEVVATRTGSDGDAALVLADAARLRTVLDAVLDNACRYSPRDTTVRVSLDAQGDGGATIRVTDEGPGIAKEHRELVFERFTRLEDPLTMRTGGVGLGLFLARQLTTAMGGSIDLEDAVPGTGTTVRIDLGAAPSA